MNEKPLVSIIVPIYNVENYIRECIQSLIFQTYKNIEIIAVDDASTDSSYEILTKINDEKIHVYKHNINKGQAAGRNLGIEKSKGDIIMFVDADDFIEQNTVSVLVSNMIKYNVDFVRFNAKSFNGVDYFKENKYSFSKYLQEDYVYKDDDLKYIYISYSASPVLYAFKKKLIKDTDIRFNEGIIHEDELFNTELYLMVNSAVFIDQEFYIRRYRKNSTMTNKSLKQLKYSFNSYIKILKKYEKLLRGYKDLKNKFIKYRINSVYRNIIDNNLDNEYKSKNLKKVNNNKKYYSKKYKNKLRFQKLIFIIKNKIKRNIL